MEQNDFDATGNQNLSFNLGEDDMRVPVASVEVVLEMA
jgi:hypothetical protein